MAEPVKTSLPLMTLDEFFAWDGGGHQGKLELIDGVVHAMAPASFTHSLIQGNIHGTIWAHLRRSGSSCRVGTETPIVPPMGGKRNARAPDVAVTCAPISDSKTLDDPVLIVEVLSPGNEDATWASIQSLAGLVSLKEILVVQSTRIGAELYRRESSGAWPQEPLVAEAGGSLHLASVDCELTMAEVYAGTHLAT